jgi:hydrogenase-4 component F
MVAAGLGGFSGIILMVFGLLSILAAATFILRQTEYKRLLAYSSIENMGIIAFGTGVGGIGAYGAVLCLIHHSLIKSSLFLTSGNLLLGFGGRLISDTGNLIKEMPRTFVAFFAGFAGISGFPPFGLFIGELFIILGAFRAGHYVGVGIFLLSLGVIFGGFAQHAMKISFEESPKTVDMKESITLVWPQYGLLLTSLILCFWIPDTLYQTIIQAVAIIGGGF